MGEGIPLDAADFANGNNIDLSMFLDHDPIEDTLKYGEDLFEGDIYLSNAQKAMIENETDQDFIFARAVSTKRKWTKIGSVVPIPYVISSSYTLVERATLARAFMEFETKTCIRY